MAPARSEALSRGADLPAASPRAGRKFVSRVTFPFLASLTSPSLCREKSEVHRELGREEAENPGSSFALGFEMAQSGVGREGDGRGGHALLSGCLECP